MITYDNLKDQHTRIERLLSEGVSYREIADRMGCHHTLISKYVKAELPQYKRRRHNNVKVLTDVPDEAELLRAELRDLRQRTNKHRAIDVQAELLLQEVRNTVVPAAPVYEPPELAEGSGKTHVQALLLSDLHCGEVVQPEAVNGLNHFNFEILQERMQGIQEALYAFQNNRPYPIDELQIWQLGDMVGGRNHAELAETNEFPVADQCYRTGLLLGQFTEALVPHYPRISVAGVGGNHPRVTLKPQNKQVFDSFDWLAYKIQEAHLANYDSVECNFPRSGALVQHIAGNNILLFHGDGIRSSMPGVPWGGVMRRVTALSQQYSQEGVALAGFALGHFHQANVVHGSVFMNGSVKGLDEYSLKQFGSGERPTQLLLTYCRDKRRLTDVSFINP